MIRRAKAEWTGAVLVCGKCSKKVGGGFGPKGRTPLAKVLRKLIGGKGRKAPLGVIETRCLKLCPRNAVTLVDTARPGEWLVVSPGDPVPEIAMRLGRGTPQA
ncbi:(2Fe-2S) ferredoxin domain-containing protein [Sphingomonas carotinifaciens]|uniref:(2Fe-2S) ferredoxin domain-containing protein n=1 Tax=Sphingomonas carotinifaciens TaxID=1166323 RepID=UPI0039A3C7EE